jgi:hypothetical protein
MTAKHIIEKNFIYHPPKNDQPARYEQLRQKAKEFAHLINELVSESREKSIAITKLEEAVMWANKAIAVNEDV